MSFHLTPEESAQLLSMQGDPPYITLMQHASMRVEWYAPQEADFQTPHLQDEIYVIAAGTAVFQRQDQRISCKQGDLLFVPAGMDHRFEQFSLDFATWVIFYGPSGGEKESGGGRP